MKYLPADKMTMEEHLTALCTENKIRIVGEGHFEVPSSDGTHYYQVRHAGAINPHVDTWKCDCPAGEHGRTCKHIRAIAQVIEWAGYGE